MWHSFRFLATPYSLPRGFRSVPLNKASVQILDEEAFWWWTFTNHSICLTKLCNWIFYNYQTVWRYEALPNKIPHHSTPNPKRSSKKYSNISGSLWDLEPHLLLLLFVVHVNKLGRLSFKVLFPHYESSQKPMLVLFPIKNSMDLNKFIFSFRDSSQWIYSFHDSSQWTSLYVEECPSWISWNAITISYQKSPSSTWSFPQLHIFNAISHYAPLRSLTPYSRAQYVILSCFNSRSEFFFSICIIIHILEHFTGYWPGLKQCHDFVSIQGSWSISKLEKWVILMFWPE